VRDEEDGEEAAAQSRELQSPAVRPRAARPHARARRATSLRTGREDSRAGGWLQRNVCECFTFDENVKVPKKVAWQPRRVIVFTEYGDTKRYLFELLTA